MLLNQPCGYVSLGIFDEFIVFLHLIMTISEAATMTEEIINQVSYGNF